MSRFRTAIGKMLVIPPDGTDPEWRNVKIIYDQVNKWFGIQLIGESEVKGYSFFVPEAAYVKTKKDGAVENEIKNV